MVEPPNPETQEALERLRQLTQEASTRYVPKVPSVDYKAKYEECRDVLVKGATALEAAESEIARLNSVLERIKSVASEV